ncbi:MAG: hypothetical protein HC770_07340 [Pseudanabaena sp. CRU_2_10]|nr:hypothetical protein [Pseudanabaena sp. CRU_2_10]
MAVSLPNIAAFQAEGADLNKLRWIETERCWFWSDPSGAEVADNINIFAPSAGIGRIYRQRAVLSDAVNYLWQIVSTPQTINTASNQAYINKSTTGQVTFNLPASPTAFQRVKFKHLTSVTNPSAINRNGSNIKGITSNIALTNSGTEAEFVYIDSTWGWEYVSNLPVRVGTSPTPLNFVSNRDTNGLFYHLGTQFGTTAWNNPQIASPQCAVYASNQSSNNGFIAQNTTLTNRNYGDAATIVSTGTGAVEPKFYISLASGANKFFRLDRFAVTLSVAGSANFRTRTTLFLGSNDNIDYNSLSGFNGFVDNGYNWNLIKSFIEDTSFDSLPNAYEANFILNSDAYYKHFKVVFLTSLGSSPSGGVRNAFVAPMEFEMYGDLLRS